MARPILEAAAGASSIDSVIALYPSNGDRGLTGAWGYTWGRVGWLGGGGFSAIVSDPWQGWAGMVDAEHGFVHEWLHQVESTYRALGLTLDELPTLHDVADRRTTRARRRRPRSRPTSSTSGGPAPGDRGIATS